MRAYAPLSLVLLAATALAGGCRDQPSSTAPDSSAGPLAARRPASDQPLEFTFCDSPGDNIASDGRGSYEHGLCDVSATFSVTDARLTTGNLTGKLISPKQAEACGGRDPRAVMVSFTQRV